jgi:L-ascorbate metabolism protein UlaG (beta-lactamase superfamily)
MQPAPHRPDPAAWPAGHLTAAWLGHATVLLDFFGATVLTDPVLEPRIGVGR